MCARLRLDGAVQRPRFQRAHVVGPLEGHAADVILAHLGALLPRQRVVAAVFRAGDRRAGVEGIAAS